MVDPDGGLRRTGPVLTNNRPMPEWRVRLGGDECNRCKTRASIPLDAIRRPRATPIWKLEGSFRCRSRGTPRYKPRVHMIKLTETHQITPSLWVHPDEER